MRSTEGCPVAPAKIGWLHHGMSLVRSAVAVTRKACLVVAGRIPLLILGHVVLLRRRCSAACSELLPVVLLLLLLLLLLRSLFVLQSGHTCRLAAAVRRYYLCCMLILRCHLYCSSASWRQPCALSAAADAVCAS